MVIKSTDTESCSAIAPSGDFVNKSIKDKTRVSLGLFFFGGVGGGLGRIDKLWK